MEEIVVIAYSHQCASTFGESKLHYGSPFGDESVWQSTHQLDGRIWPYRGSHGFGELGFDSGEDALETATTTKVGSRRENYPM